ncbi:sarcosine oxidase subunit gamma family protein [uncultured Erythrobacter sp.]|uniref:sarcosine oxidase subunit gamma n=1 Tax=uncultured Erythrobacter sp. TaxID=263913 RepID=UPI002608AE1D|nr:sarcosine oxidase subunit gamma family protein [uncultured Erythrobacter sp.]
MADLPLRTEPVPIEPATFANVTIALAPPMARYSLRARDASLLEKAIGRKLPSEIGAISDDALMLGPDEWLLRLPGNTPLALGEGAPVSITDVSERQIAIVVEGASAVQVLQGANPLDLANFPVGNGKRTIFDGVEILLIRETETRFVVEVWRSFAEFVWGTLVKCASEG